MSSAVLPADMMGQASVGPLDRRSSNLSPHEPDENLSRLVTEAPDVLSASPLYATGADEISSPINPTSAATNDFEAQHKRNAISYLIANLRASVDSPKADAAVAARGQSPQSSDGVAHSPALSNHPQPLGSSGSFVATAPMQASYSSVSLDLQSPGAVNGLQSGPVEGSNSHSTQPFIPYDNFAPIEDPIPDSAPKIPQAESVQGEELPCELQESAERGQIEAFAKLAFADGFFYMNTHQCELGRDVRAYQAALARATEAKNLQGGEAKSSSGRASGPSRRGVGEAGSVVKGSVISEKGGFCGVDDKAAVEEEENERRQRKDSRKSYSSQVSASSLVKPEDLDIRQSQSQFDYQNAAVSMDEVEYDKEQPAPVTLAHMPRPDAIPLIPIHHNTDSVKSEIENHKSISRRHVRIAWDYRAERFRLHVLGRNGAFLDNVYMPKGSVGDLDDGSRIQISGIEITFHLPSIPREPSTDNSAAEDGELSPRRNKHSTTPTSVEAEASEKKKKDRNQTVSKNKTAQKPPPAQPPIQFDENGQPIPRKKRGPGRPPKDGVMSNRERKELERRRKLEEARAANGGVTPPPLAARVKTARLSTKADTKADQPKTKRPYNKRKRAGSVDILQSIENEDGEGGGGGPVPKRKRASRSPSPEYKPREQCTAEELSKPPDTYAKLLYQVLDEVHPRPLTLKQIYREFKLRWPYFIYCTDTIGWQSSIRHNLNGEHEKLFEKGDKEGKGYAWRAIKGALKPREDAEKKKLQQAAEQKAKSAQSQKQPNIGQGNWQHSGSIYPPYVGQTGPHSSPYYGSPPDGVAWPQPPVRGPPPNHGQIPPPNGNGPGSTHPQNQQGVPANQGPTYPQNGPPPTFYGPQPASQVPQNRPQQATPNSPHPTPPTTAQYHRPLPSQQSYDPYVPCTPTGLHRMQVFEDSIMKETAPEEIERMKLVFVSVRQRVLNGAKESSVPGGETDIEGVCLHHFRNFCEMEKNPNFKGFRDEEQRQKKMKKDGLKAAAAPSGPPTQSSTPNQEQQTQPVHQNAANETPASS